jgi:predicted MFS family arabinose efflux permease
VLDRLNPWRGLRGLPRDVWILCGASLINRAGTMVLPFLVLYLTKALGYSDARAGVIMAVYGGLSLVASPISGRLCDRYGAHTVMRASLVSSALVMLAFPLVKSFPAVVAATALLSVTGEMFRPANMALLSELAEGPLRKPAFALARLAVNLGMSVGPAAGGFLAAISFPALFIVDGVTALAASAVLIFALRSRPRAAPPPALAASSTSGAGSAAMSRSILGAFADRRLLFFFLLMLPPAAIFFQHTAAMPLYIVRDLGLPETMIGLLFTINTWLIVLVEVPLNAATARWPHRLALALGALLIGVGFGAMALATGAISLAATAVVWTFGEMILFPGSSAYVADIAPPSRRGEYMGIYSMSFGLCFTLAPPLGLAVFNRFGAQALWAGTLALGVLAAALMTRLPDAQSPDERAPKKA